MQNIPFRQTLLSFHSGSSFLCALSNRSVAKRGQRMGREEGNDDNSFDQSILVFRGARRQQRLATNANIHHANFVGKQIQEYCRLDPTN